MLSAAFDLVLFWVSFMLSVVLVLLLCCVYHNAESCVCFTVVMSVVYTECQVLFYCCSGCRNSECCFGFIVVLGVVYAEFCVGSIVVLCVP